VATVLKRTEPLKEYLASDKPLSPQNRLGLIAIIEQFEQRIGSLKNKKVGRPQRKSDASPVDPCSAWTENHGLPVFPQ
jgi:hypothetical protein